MEPRLSEERRGMVAEMLQAAGAVTVPELQERFGISPMTARRDLAVLAERGVARRTHGGAVLPSLAAREDSFAHRLRDAPEEKTRLAEAAYAMLRPGETVFLDASSTTYFVARMIAERGLAVRVITNSLPVLQELSSADCEVVAIGGSFRQLTRSYVGPAAVRAVRDHFADRLLLSVTGVTAGGILADADVLEAEVKRTMLAQAEHSVLLLDASKLRARGRQAIAPITALSDVLTDGLAPEQARWLDRLRTTSTP
ncbi:DeoR/GlpR transcriptional regulator [Solirubrobacter sp. CPCC 204708]|uniref:DeoR/GlpR family DNA-binding transcription regulator n=1 Tax=Solirubrobacter deserti TaxID=2282478 RepID=A0ABT4RRT0_9ACTN|nr:DeoR/GlpR family DNA-binding transcription regulator [Solirubrobacter deserti]MBE2320726.1 DeoR/GlpR transcriptional regulator [Solirubrobacter deserti]MDA0140950.1 DeoR/GlpR family DNA-binding transcription regulator [Solirubrobacter deserti]